MNKEILIKSGLGLGGVLLVGAGGVLVDRVLLNPGPASVDGGVVKTPSPVVTPGAFATVTPDGARLAARADTATVVPTATVDSRTSELLSQINQRLAALEDKKSPTSTVTPRSTEVPKAQATGTVSDHEMKPGETYLAKGGSMIKGDVVVGKVRLFDNDEWTGLIVELDEDAPVYAEWGANVSLVGPDQTVRNSVFGKAVEEMKARGCDKGQGCDRVDVVKFPGGKPQGK